MLRKALEREGLRAVYKDDTSSWMALEHGWISVSGKRSAWNKFPLNPQGWLIGFMLPKCWYIISRSQFPFCSVTSFSRKQLRNRTQASHRQLPLLRNWSGYILFMLWFFHSRTHFSICLFLHNLTAHKVGFKICLGEGQARRICIVEVYKDKMHQEWKHGGGGVYIL